MSQEIYQESILRLARSAIGAGSLTAPDASVTLDNPLCGDRVTLDVRLREGRLTEIAHRVRGCLLCEASASIAAQCAVGEAAAALRDVEAALTAMLRERAPAPGGRWSELEVFAPVAAVRSRHLCVLLPFEALSEAVKKAGA
jgi:nitrogen fixation NifU-like protein